MKESYKGWLSCSLNVLVLCMFQDELAKLIMSSFTTDTYSPGEVHFTGENDDLH